MHCKSRLSYCTDTGLQQMGLKNPDFKHARRKHGTTTRSHLIIRAFSCQCVHCRGTLCKRMHCLVLIASPPPIDADGSIIVFITNIELLIVSIVFQPNPIGRIGNTIRVSRRSRPTSQSSLKRLLFINAMSETNELKSY